MGQMRFVVPRPERLVPYAAEQACLAGAEGIPWECGTVLSGDSLTIERDTRESGYLYFPWDVPGRGLVQLCSGSLMERARPYHLPVELARGTVNRLRAYAWAWQTAGMDVPPQFDALLKQATSELTRAATGQQQPQTASDHADEAIRLALDAADVLAREYSDQVLAGRRSQSPTLGTLLAGRLEAPPTGETAEQFIAAFNTAVVPLAWPDLEPKLGTYLWEPLDRLVAWCEQHQLRICMGPLVLLDKHALPDWLFLDDDYEEVQASILLFISQVVERYRGRVNLWHVAARLNQEGAFRHSEEQRLRLVVEAVDRVRALDGRTPVVVSFNQPWAEYIARQDQELTPLHFADTLVRGELGLAGVGLEMHYGYWPGGTLPRDPLEVNRQLDRWAQIGVPLMAILAAPSSADPDPLARHPARPLAALAPGGPTPDWQQELVQWLLPLLLGKQSVQAIVWDAWDDRQPHELPHSGLIDSSGRPKPALETLTELRRELLGF
jgi:hypothetical protein